MIIRSSSPGTDPLDDVRPASEDRSAGARHRILAAATRVFGTYGFSKSTVQEIAAAAHVSKPLFYRHFRKVSGVLMEDGSPEGGKYSHDGDNRPDHGTTCDSNDRRCGAFDFGKYQLASPVAADMS